MADSDDLYEASEGDFDDEFGTEYDNEYEDPNMCFDVPQDTLTTSKDHSQYLNVDVEFETGKELVAWAKKMAATYGHRLIVTSSQKNVYVVIRCHVSGKGREKRTEGVKQRNVGTNKCGCPFRIYCSKNRNDELWRMNLKHGIHTHPTLPYLTGQGPDSCLTPEEYEVVKLLRRSHVKPTLIMDRLKKDNPQTSTSVKHVYNQLEKMKKENMAGKTVIQHVMSNLQESRYEYWYRSNEADDTLIDLMFAAPISLKLLWLFSHVILMDCTYKINRVESAHNSSKGWISASSCAVNTIQYQLDSGVEYQLTKIKGFVAGSIVSYVNVVADGNCGYRCVAEAVFRDQHRWSRVRRDLIADMYERFGT
ncbi:PREDICTED: uncharacterized protein LOC105955736 [Erythranthe guttata]|uniref:uncharacterized protein LOC105955736 n=1 Tax=Erythranthe guttata TaxID=4155 RepID=UPI00064DF087|nr:PREDICTED: uncharacterized protein LOC105955736 [Erythranthe guttata]|eukprot:XP_012834984.1 PREDICTED: uncharacterized protein LOC105955736 [Erythranthe guttata]